MSSFWLECSDIECTSARYGEAREILKTPYGNQFPSRLVRKKHFFLRHTAYASPVFPCPLACTADKCLLIPHCPPRIAFRLQDPDWAVRISLLEANARDLEAGFQVPARASKSYLNSPVVSECSSYSDPRWPKSPWCLRERQPKCGVDCGGELGRR